MRRVATWSRNAESAFMSPTLPEPLAPLRPDDAPPAGATTGVGPVSCGRGSVECSRPDAALEAALPGGRLAGGVPVSLLINSAISASRSSSACSTDAPRVIRTEPLAGARVLLETLQ